MRLQRAGLWLTVQIRSGADSVSDVRKYFTGSSSYLCMMTADCLYHDNV